MLDYNLVMREFLVQSSNVYLLEWIGVGHLPSSNISMRIRKEGRVVETPIDFNLEDLPAHCFTLLRNTLPGKNHVQCPRHFSQLNLCIKYVININQY